MRGGGVPRFIWRGLRGRHSGAHDDSNHSNEDAVTMSNADKISDTLAVAPEAGTDATEGAAIGDAKK